MSDADRLVAWFRANARPLPWRTSRAILTDRWFPS